MNVLAYSIIGLGVVAVWHFIFELIILPSLRQQLKFKIFDLRDRLRTLKADHSTQCGNAAFHQLDDSLSWQIDNQHKLTFSLIHDTTAELKNNPDLHAKVEKRLADLNSCELPEYRSIREERNKLFTQALIANSLGWAIYLVPILFICMAMEKIVQTTKLWTGMSDREMDRISGYAT
jgi:hypothetical protein